MATKDIQQDQQKHDAYSSLITCLNLEHIVAQTEEIWVVITNPIFPLD